MDDGDRQTGASHESGAAPEAVEADAGSSPSPDYDESLVEELSALIDDGRNYAQAEIAFQKTRAKLAGRSVAIALACLIVAIILLHIAFLALAVGLVIALAPLVTIWGAIAIVVGGLLLLVATLCFVAYRYAAKLGGLFASDEGTA